jgi:EmrB/QacA subfamily drug resistance transporter
MLKYLGQLDSRWVALYVLCTGMLMIVLDITVVNVALPSIQNGLHFSSASLAWVVNAYLIAFGGLLLLAGRLGDLIGRRRVFLLGLTVFSLGSLSCGLSADQAVLVVSRFIQGAGGAFTSAVILGMIVTMFPTAREQAKAIGVFAFVASAGGAAGLLVGGVLTQAINWHWIFFVNLPIGLATAVLALRFVPGDRGIGTGAGIDLPGALLITASLMLGVYTIVDPATRHGWGSPSALGLAGLTVGLLAAFIAREATAARPLLSLSIFRSRNLSAANVMQVLGAVAMFGTFFVGALYAQRVLGYRPLTIGLAFLPAPSLMGILSLRYTDRLVTRFGARRLCIVGGVMISAALAVLAQAPVGADYWTWLFPAMAVLGLGAGTCFPSLMSLAMSGAAPQEAGLASGLVNTTGQVGGALGLAVIASLTSAKTAHLLGEGRGRLVALTAGYHIGFVIAALAALGLAVIAALGLAPVTAALPAAEEADMSLSGSD